MFTTGLRDGIGGSGCFVVCSRLLVESEADKSDETRKCVLMVSGDCLSCADGRLPDEVAARPRTLLEEFVTAEPVTSQAKIEQQL
jgi:hypothetical protein